MKRTIPVLLAALTVACVSVRLPTTTSTPSGVDPFVARSVERLVESASLRVDLSTMRLCVFEIEAELAPPDGRTARADLRWTAAPSTDAFEDEVEGQLVAALAGRVHVFDAELAGSPDVSDAPRATSLAEVAAAGATHALLGTIEQRGEELLFTVRVVDTRTSLVVAADRTLVDLDELGEWTRAVLAGRTPVADVDAAHIPLPSPIAPPETTRGPEPTAPSPIAQAPAPQPTDPPSSTHKNVVAKRSEPAVLQPPAASSLKPVRMNRGPIPGPYKKRRSAAESPKAPEGPAAQWLARLGRRIEAPDRD